MDTDTTKPTTGQPVELQTLITAAFNDVLTVHGKMAMQQMQFMLDTCFTKNGDVYTPKMVTMAIQDPEFVPGSTNLEPASRQPITRTIDLPLLTITPLNTLAFDSVNINFDLDITSVTNHQNVEAGDDNISIFVKINKTTEAAAADTPTNRLNVSVTAKQIPMPPGLAAVIDGLMKSIQIVPSPQT